MSNLIEAAESVAVSAGYGTALLLRSLAAEIRRLEAELAIMQDSSAAYASGKAFMRGQLEPQLTAASGQLNAMSRLAETAAADHDDWKQRTERALTMLATSEAAAQETARKLLVAQCCAERDRDLAIAHDRQPYPTAAAYELVCAARDKWQCRAERAEAVAVAAKDLDALRAMTYPLPDSFGSEVQRATSNLRAALAAWEGGKA